MHLDYVFSDDTRMEHPLFMAFRGHVRIRKERCMRWKDHSKVDGNGGHSIYRCLAAIFLASGQETDWFSFELIIRRFQMIKPFKKFLHDRVGTPPTCGTCPNEPVGDE